MSKHSVQISRGKLTEGIIFFIFSIFVKNIHIPSATLRRKICRERFDISTSNILEGCKIMHYVPFSQIFILIPLKNYGVNLLLVQLKGLGCKKSDAEL